MQTRTSVQPVKRPLPVFAWQVENRLDRFHNWLKSHGAENLMCDTRPHGPQELCRFLSGSTEYFLLKDDLGVLSGSAMPFLEAWLHQKPFPVEKPPLVKRRVQGRVPELLERDGPNCYLCWKPLGEDISIEHLLALAHGGSNHSSNLVLTHTECNKILGINSVSEKVRLRYEKRKELNMSETAKNDHHLNSDRSVAVSDTYRMSKDMTGCPRGVKSLLLGGGGVLVIANYDGDLFWREWAALPGRAL